MAYRTKHTRGYLQVVCSPDAALHTFARRAGAELRTECGGRGTCGKCKVHILRGLVTPPTPRERKLLSEEEIDRGVRLACQTKALGKHTIILSAPEHTTSGSLPGDTFTKKAVRSGPMGLVIDFGTTTITAQIISLPSGTVVDTADIENPQKKFGADVMSRLHHARNEAGKSELRLTALAALNNLLERWHALCASITAVTITGNTVMQHLLLGLPVQQLGTYPYTPAVKSAHTLSAHRLGLNCAPDVPVHFLPNISGCIGSDHVAMILATGIHVAEKTVLGIDIGTNTEITLAHGGSLTSTSCASGPALEGAHISCGVPAGNGAIYRVRIPADTVEFETIGNAPPSGLCGSGAVDGVAELYRRGSINAKGHFRKGSGKGNDAAYILVPANRSASGYDIALTQKDIQEILLAKAAIRAGIEMLLSKLSLAWHNVDELVIAGNFGTHLSVDSAEAIGMFPAIEKDTTCRIAGNASVNGARTYLASPDRRRATESIASRIKNYNLAEYAGFSRIFARHIVLP